ncbi:MAG TPA: restriction endonuclease [Candidatus Acidoferrum sp.]|nr:restriction endonuclease [Candidatus Acidoferrum sp.]
MPRRSRRRYRESDPFADLFATAGTFLLLGLGLYIYSHRNELLTWGSILLVLVLAGSAAYLIFRKLKSKNGPLTWDDDKILRMLKGGTPTQFEQDIADMFEALGYRTGVVGRAGDRGIDVRAYRTGKTYFIQCKKFMTQVVTPHDVRDFLGAVTNVNDPAEKGFFVTTNGFTEAARQTAEGNPRIELIDGNELVRYWKMAFGKAAAEKAQVASAPVMPAATPVTVSTPVAPAPANANTCPRCGGGLVLRMARYGANTGKQFWGCSNFAKTHCNYVRDAA